MTKTEDAPVRTYDDHAALLSRVDPNLAGWRGCAGVALFLDGDAQPAEGQPGGDHGFVRNEDMTWMTAVDIPVPWMQSLPRPAHVMQLRKAGLRMGVPTLDPAGVEWEFDYWQGPLPKLGLPGRVVKAADAINNAMTSTAFAFRKFWQPYRWIYESWAEVADKPAIILGSRKYDPAVVKDFTWVPKPWVEVDPRAAGTLFARMKETGFTDVFKSVVVDLFVAGMPVTSPVTGYFTGTSPYAANGVRYTQFNFREESGARQAVIASASASSTSQKGMRVMRGTQVGTDAPPVPRAFYAWTAARQWGELLWAYRPEVIDLVLGNAFSGMFRQVGKTWLMPFAVLGADVSYAFGTGSLWWDVSPLFRDGRDFSLASEPSVFVMPTMRMGRWDGFRDALGHVAVDLTPTDTRFRAHALDRQMRKTFPATTDGYSGDAQGEVVPVAVVPGRPVGTLPVLGDDAAARAVADAPDRPTWEELRRSPATAVARSRGPVPAGTGGKTSRRRANKRALARAAEEDLALAEFIAAGRDDRDDGTDDRGLALATRGQFWDRIQVLKPVAQTKQSASVLGERSQHMSHLDEEIRLAVTAEAVAEREAEGSAEAAFEHGVPPEEMAEERWEDDGGPAPVESDVAE